MTDPTPSVPVETATAPPALPGPPPQPPNTIFKGPNGIRAGWRIAVFLAIAAVVVFVFGVVLVVVGLASRNRNAATELSGVTPFGLAVTEGALLFCTAIPALIMTLIEKRKWSRYGLPLRSAFRSRFWIGGVAGFLSISTCLLAIFALHGFHLEGFAIHGSTIVSSTLIWSLTFILVGLAEEFSFRGYLQYTLTTGIGFWPAAILLSLGFGAAHYGNPGETYFGLGSVVLFGLVFCLVLQRTGNLWWPVGFHAGWDWGQTFFYGVRDSGFPAYHNLFNSSFSGPQWLTGGSVGPEASIFTPIVLLLFAFLFTRVYRENQYQVP